MVESEREKVCRKIAEQLSMHSWMHVANTLVHHNVSAGLFKRHWKINKIVIYRMASIQLMNFFVK